MSLWIKIFISKCINRISRLRGYQGTTVGGTVALRLDPLILKKMKKDLKRVVFVTGTNGKTTTANTLANIIKTSGQTVIHNKEGANMLTGITSSMIKASDWTGKVTADWAILEVDEGSLPAILKQLVPDQLIILNFFRDQLDRYGEIDVLIRNMMNSIKQVDTQLILNADDPLVMQFGDLNKKTIYVGIQDGALNFGQYAMGESTHCPSCGEEMVYSSIRYGQLGDYSCSCGFSRPQPNYEITSVQSSESLSFEMAGRNYTTTLKGNYNLYNLIPAITAASESGIDEEHIQQGLSQYSLNNGRMETFYHQGFPYILNLNKNPSGTNVIMNELIGDTKPKQLLIILNDNVADGEDISWIWDVDFQALHREEIERIVCAGSRSSELALRLKYAEIPLEKVEDISNISEAIQYVIEHPLQTYILPTYTALEPAKKDLVSKLQAV